MLHEVTPDVPEKISQKIQGHVHVTVRVLVDPTGDVTGVLMENPGPSKYFARLADNAAREWQFIPEDSERARVWLVTFVFTRDGVSTRAIEQ
ncbi:energy transducer TonB family protein [Steroidobacter cummioxidans]|uniref:energy transducer TonB family protein n=1 Tax=Steroidobacter cummioxidans TaxID=1803913 RepID=UPI001F4E8E3A|nr:energy transducer TonB [Steroidobacter cummioxidans]